ncbi:unnamed protein product [Amaranthus hypochondriacus]
MYLIVLPLYAFALFFLLPLASDSTFQLPFNGDDDEDEEEDWSGSVVKLLGWVNMFMLEMAGVLTGVKPLGNVHLGYGIKKLDGRYFQDNSTEREFGTSAWT